MSDEREEVEEWEEVTESLEERSPTMHLSESVRQLPMGFHTFKWTDDDRDEWVAEREVDDGEEEDIEDAECG